MIFTETPLSGVYVVELEKRGDDRGFFARTFCAREFSEHGLQTQFVQINTSSSADPGTIRGLHYQRPPAEETKLIRCIQGALWDVVVDVRPCSPTYLQSVGVELSAENGKQMYVPKGFAHGFMTLQPNTIAVYMADAYYTPDLEEGFRWNDPGLSVTWPLPATVVSKKDKTWPLLQDTDGLNRYRYRQ
jgi:dTDP-4-dehydrorhamnose 3,5-epimerase